MHTLIQAFVFVYLVHTSKIFLALSIAHTFLFLLLFSFTLANVVTLSSSKIAHLRSTRCHNRGAHQTFVLERIHVSAVQGSWDVMLQVFLVDRPGALQHRSCAGIGLITNGVVTAWSVIRTWAPLLGVIIVTTYVIVCGIPGYTANYKLLLMTPIVVTISLRVALSFLGSVRSLFGATSKLDFMVVLLLTLAVVVVWVRLLPRRK